MNKRILLTSILSLVLCVSLIAGSTFALFTSEAKTDIAVNSGKVQVSATINQESLTLYSPVAIASDFTYDPDQNAATATNFANGGSASFDEKGNLKLENITPGDSATFTIQVENKSNVAILYQTIVSAAEGDKALLGGLEVTIDGSTFTGTTIKTPWTRLEAGEAIAPAEKKVEVALPADAGDEWQEKSVTLSFAIYAVQANADITDKPLVLTADQTIDLDAIGFISTNGSNGVIQATAGNARDAGKPTVTITGNGTVNAEMGDDDYAMAVWANGGDVVINGGTYTQSKTGDDTQYDLIYASKGGNITINGGSFKSATPAWTLNCKDGSGSTITVMGGRFYQFNPAEAQTGAGEIIIPDGFEVIHDGDWYEVVPNFFKNEAGEYIVNSAKGLEYFARIANNGNDFAGETIKLDASVDLANVAWTAISSFAGTFDGQGNTIANLKNASLFGTIAEAGVVKNLNLKDVSMSGELDRGGFLANTLNGKAEYCTVKNATATSTYHGFSGLVGFSGVTAVIDYCSVDNYTLTVTNTEDNYDKVGGLVGQSSGTTITNSSVSNITLNGVYKTKEWGGFVGRHANNGVIENCTATNVKINVSGYAQSVGGFVGAPANATIKSCDVNGVTIRVNNCGWVGGFAGYIGDAKYYDFDDCNVTGMSITLETDTVSGIGGFCGRAAYTLTIKNCSVEGVIDASETAIAGGKIKALVGFDRVDQYPDIMVTENNTTNVTIQ